jgi:hypothetical protein
MTFEKRLSKIPTTFISNQDAIKIIIENKGLLPIHVNPNNLGTILWLDFGDHQLTEAKFIYSIDKILSKDNSPNLIETNIDVLSDENLFGDTLYPTGFIFFVHRCGSTLLAKALAQSKSNIVINEATSLYEQFWIYLSENWKKPILATRKNLTLVRNLILIMGRRRTAEHQSYFVKFNPWHSTILMEMITLAFPKVPCLFLYRDINEVFASVIKVSAPIMSHIRGTEFAAILTGLPAKKTLAMSSIEYFARLYGQFMLAALNISTHQITYLNYNQLTSENFAFILRRAFNYSVSIDELTLMKSQFNYYSKDDSNTQHFSCDKLEKQKMISAEITAAIKHYNLVDYYKQLDLSARNVFNEELKIMNEIMA